MRRTIWTLAVLALGFLGGAFAQVSGGQGGGTLGPSGGKGVCVTTVANLSSSCGTVKGTLATITDGTSNVDCTTGGASTTATCIYNGTSWVSAGGSGSGTVTGITPGLGMSSGGTQSPINVSGTLDSFMPNTVGAAGADPCARYITRAGTFPGRKISGQNDAAGASTSCGTDNLDNANNEFLIPSNAILTTDVGFTLGDREKLTGDNVGNGTAVGTINSTTGSEIGASANWPLSSGGVLTASGTNTSGASTLTLINTGAAATLLVPPGAIFLVSSHEYVVKSCGHTGVAPCATSQATAGASTWYSVPPTTAVTFNITPNLAGTITAGTAATYEAPLHTMGDQNTQLNGSGSSQWQLVKNIYAVGPTASPLGIGFLKGVEPQENSVWDHILAANFNHPFVSDNNIHAAPDTNISAIFTSAGCGLMTTAGATASGLEWSPSQGEIDDLAVFASGANCTPALFANGAIHLTNSPFTGTAGTGRLKRGHVELNGSSSTGFGILADATSGNWIIQDFQGASATTIQDGLRVASAFAGYLRYEYTVPTTGAHTVNFINDISPSNLIPMSSIGTGVATGEYVIDAFGTRRTDTQNACTNMGSGWIYGGGVWQFCSANAVRNGFDASGNLRAAVLTLTGNVSAHSWLGNNTGISAVPSFQTIGTGDLPGSGITTINGTSCTIGGSCTAVASGMSALGLPIAATATTITSSTTAGTNQGTYQIIRANTVQGTAVSPTEQQVGDCAAPTTITGAATTGLIAYTDVIGCTVRHDFAGSAGATITIPTPTTLNNTHPIFNYCNDSASNDTLTPTTFTIRLDGSAAAASKTAAANTCYKITVDPTNASVWTANTVLSASTKGIPIGNVGTAGLSGTSPVTIAGTGAVGCATCVTSAASLTSNALMTGAGSQASQTVTTGTGVVTALGVNTGSAGAFVVNGGALGTPSSGTLTNATGLPINGVVSATGAIPTIADGNNPLVINCALTSGTTCQTNGETTAATTAGAVEHQLTTLTTSTAIPLQITQGANGPANAAAPAIINVSAAAAGGLAGASNAGSTGAGYVMPTGAGSVGGATAGNGGAGGTVTHTLGAGGNAGGTSTNSGGAGGGFVVTTGAGGNGGTGTGSAGSGGPVTFTMGSPGTNSATGGAGAVGLFNVTGNAPASTANTTGVNAGTVFSVSGVAGGASSNAAGTAGSGSVASINSGTGGAGTGTNAVGGAGGNINITAGNGGNSAGTGINSNGGNIIATPGAAGTGGSGTAGKAGVFQVAGPNAGFFGFQQGTANTTTNTQIPANTIVYQAPAAVTSYTVTYPGTASTGIPIHVNAANAVTQNFSGDSNHAVSQLSKTALVTTFTVCAATAGTACGQAGQYRLTYNFWGSGTACSVVTLGSVALNITYTDENAVAHTTISVPMWDQKTGAVTAGAMNFNTALGTEGAGGSYIISTNGTIIQAATTYTACTTGTGTYNLRISAEQLQ